MELRALPQNNEAEKQVLGSILKHNEAIYDVVDILKPEDFYASRHALIFSTMIKMSSNNTPIDMVTLANILGADKIQAIGGVSYLAELFAEVISTTTIRKYAEIVRDKSERRKVIKTCQDALDKVYNDEQVVKGIIGTLEDELLNVGFENENKILTDEELMEKTLTMIQENYERGGDITGISTGLNSLDQATNGIVKGDFIVIAGRPSMGKTCFALNIANSVAKTNKVALFELEMSAEKIGARRLAAQTLVNATRLPRGKIEPQEWERIMTKSAEIAYRNNMFTDTTAGITMTEIKAKCKKLKLKYGLDVVIIDHLTLITPTNTKESRVNQVGEITRQAKIMAKDLDVAVIMLSQLSRAVEQRADKIPIMSDLRESGTIEQDADLIILLFRDEYYNPDTEKKGIIEAIIAKQRDGRTGTLQFAYKPEYQLITEKPKY
ncbi:replicative DNA helicase [Clostridium swellfunianum]|uniref:replicative DNA helicase n=1 Tax=Clostridium swellfunianum TaxID=1367462 RepID=UPI00202E80C1|nr:replicative DNA helicase [Clostridium swellfunianum]MCM0648672.1 replicative DNA helicase [Clostridium swellfunianum]